MVEIPKVWGKEIWIANEPEYCCKLLHVTSGACSSVHFHPLKKETFYCLQGQVELMVSGNVVLMAPGTEPVTIHPGTTHSFRGIDDSVLVEASTHHDDKDVVRLTESRGKEPRV